MEPPEKVIPKAPWIFECYRHEGMQLYHMPPELFVSDGSENSIVGKWVKENGPGIHHIAFQVSDVEATMREWKEKGYAEFSSEKPFQCPGLTQVFTRPSDITGVVYEFIKRDEFGFCKDNVINLMLSSPTNKGST